MPLAGVRAPSKNPSSLLNAARGVPVSPRSPPALGAGNGDASMMAREHSSGVLATRSRSMYWDARWPMNLLRTEQERCATASTATEDHRNPWWRGIECRQDSPLECRSLRNHDRASNYGEGKPRNLRNQREPCQCETGSQRRLTRGRRVWWLAVARTNVAAMLVATRRLTACRPSAARVLSPVRVHRQLGPPPRSRNVRILRQYTLRGRLC